jgi:MFS family permease
MKTAKRNAVILSAAQAVNGSMGPIAISMGAWGGAYLHPQNIALATLPVAAYSVGTALFAFPVGMITKALGRRNGFILGSLMGVIGAMLAAYALSTKSFFLFGLGFSCLGAASAFVQQYRFAAADHGSDHFKSKAISWVLTGGVFAAILGPQIAMRTKDMLSPTPYAGAFIALAALLVVGIAVLTTLTPLRDHPDDQPATLTPSRPLRTILKQPKFIVALLCAISSYGLMTFMMTGATLAMTNHGHSQNHAVMGIQWHVLAMYAPSYFTGLLLVRFGKPAVISTGLLLLIACSGIALAGVDLWNFWGSLVLLGLGWNFGFIGATALLGETYFESEKNKVQGLHDCILFSFVTTASLMSGAVLHLFGWTTIAIILLPVSLISLLSLVFLRIYENRIPS